MPLHLLNTGQKRKAQELLIAHFASGWGPLVPYLLLYLAYAGLKWPINPVGKDHARFFLPLLYAYWTVHVAYLGLGIFALTRWWNREREISGYPHAMRREQWLSIFPWVLLGVMFAVPGFYLEYPSDPWEHLRRISEWRDLTIVTDHRAWLKSGYFLAYSFVSAVPSESWPAILRIYHVAVSLLLCWQYFRLARDVNASSRAAFVFVLLQGLQMGNNLFSFYRYYSPASTIFAQIAVVALLRLGMKAAAAVQPRREGTKPVWPALALGGSALALVICFSHIQGIGLAAIGLAAIAIQCSIQKNPAALWLWTGGALGVSLLIFLFFPLPESVQKLQHAGGWFTRWYGFDLLNPDSTAGGRTGHILGFFGAGNLVAGLWLLRRNHVVGWLTVFPLIALSLPFVAIPFTAALERAAPGNVVTFHRMLLGIPVGLALVIVGEKFLTDAIGRFAQSSHLPFGALLLGLLAAVTIPPGRPFFNRMWNAFSIPPADAQLNYLSERLDSHPPFASGRQLLTTRSIAFAAEVAGHANQLVPYYRGERQISPPIVPVRETEAMIAALRATFRNGVPTDVWIPSPLIIFTPVSQSGLLSQHWSPQQIPLSNTGAAEIRQIFLRAENPRRIELTTP